MTELKPCPFCGGPAEVQRYNVLMIDTYTPGCERCGFWMYPWTWDASWTKEQAIKIWNKRVSER